MSYHCFTAHLVFLLYAPIAIAYNMRQITKKNLSQDKTANVNFLRRHRTRTTKYENYAVS